MSASSLPHCRQHSFTIEVHFPQWLSDHQRIIIISLFIPRHPFHHGSLYFPSLPLREAPRRRRCTPRRTRSFWQENGHIDHGRADHRSACPPCNDLPNLTAVPRYSRWLQTLRTGSHGSLGKKDSTTLAMERVPIRSSLLCAFRRIWSTCQR